MARSRSAHGGASAAAEPGRPHLGRREAKSKRQKLQRREKAKKNGPRAVVGFASPSAGPAAAAAPTSRGPAHRPLQWKLLSFGL